MGLYRRWIEQDLPRWREKGWLTEDGAAAIAADVRAREASIRLQDVFAILGAVLLCLAAAAFVAANWDALSRPLKLVLTVGLLWATYGTSLFLHHADMRTGAHAAAMVAVGLFGGAIMLISQMYHLSGHPPDAVLAWGLGGLVAGVLLSSAPVLALTALLLGIWSEMEALWEGWRVHYAILPLWFLTAAAIWRAGWRGGFHLIALGLLYWVFMLGGRTGDSMFEATALIGLATMALGLAADTGLIPSAPLAERGRALTVYGFLAAFSGLFFWHLPFADDGTFAEIAPAAALVLGFTIAILWLAIARDHRTLLWWSYGAVGAELLFVYLATLGTLLETSLFFLIAGLLVIGMALLAWRLAQRGRAEEEAAP
ncbi:MAG: DUF2157 domain-containing protein [Pseudomonadota bacterium]